MLFSVGWAFVGRDEIRASLKTPSWFLRHRDTVPLCFRFVCVQLSPDFSKTLAGEKQIGSNYRKV